jgi:hypothetical protein
MELNLRVHDPSGSVSRDVRLDLQEASTVDELVDAIVELFGWPRETMDGEAIAYAARRLGEQDALDGTANAGGLNLVHGDALVLGPIRIDGTSS